MENKELKNIISSGESTDKMPVLFIGRELYDVQYPAPGSPELAFDVKQTVSQTVVGLDLKLSWLI